MSAVVQSKAEIKLAELQLKFKNSLPEKIGEIESLWQSVCESKKQGEDLITFHRLFHTMIGTAGTFGAVALSTAARELEETLKPLLAEHELSPEIKLHIDVLIKNMKNIVDEWQPTGIKYLEPLKNSNEKKINKGGLVYLVEDDVLLAQEIALKLEENNFVVKTFFNLQKFVDAYLESKPDAIVMDIVFDISDTAGADTIADLKKKNDNFPPVIFISIRTDIEARLAAAAAGALRYFVKPVNTSKLAKTLDGLIEKVVTDKYKVLLVDDDIELLEFYKTVLSQEDILIKIISNPLETLTAIDEFEPDVIVLDVYMPEYSGPQIAQVIRQDDRWAMTPIMFLSSESNIDIQLNAMNLGGESFMLKPIQEQHLIDSVLMKAKKSRWNYRLNYDLSSALRDNEFKSIASDHHNITSVTDANGKIVNVNDKFCVATGYSRAELLGNTYDFIKSKIQLENSLDEMWETVKLGQLWYGQICSITKDNKETWLTSTMIPFIDEHGEPYKYILEQTDITKVIQSEERLERSQEFANIGTWDWNIISGDLYWSDRIWPLFGYEKEVTETTYENFISAIHPEDQKYVSEAVINCVESGAEYNIEHRVVWPDKSIHWLQESGDVIRNTKNEVMHMLGVVQDITTKKNMEIELNKSRDEANGANKAKTEFLSSMSHELRTPMNAIMGFSQLLALDSKNTLTDLQKENISEILTAGKHLLELIDDVLDLAKIEAGKIELSLENIYIGEVINQSLQLMSPLASNDGIIIELYKDNDKIEINELMDNDICVFADFTRLKQVMINLLSNAIKYNSKNGIIKIHLDIVDDFFHVSVVDTGEGLTEDGKLNLFKSFERLGAENSGIEGTGIGLVITKKLMSLMDGNIGVKSKHGEGCDFWIEVPMVKDIQETKPINDNGYNEITSKKDIVKIDSKKTILYIEDNLANLRLVTQLISTDSIFEMLTATDGVSGLSIAIEKQPDLILLDINLPEMNGYEVLSELKNNKETSNIIVFAVTANAMKKDMDKGYAEGFDEYITKPIDISDLMTKINAYLKLN